MNRSSRWSRLPWVLGLALLTASLVGAGHVLQSRPGEAPDAPTAAPAERTTGTPGVVTHGTVDVEGGIVHLAPVQAGEVTEVLVYEGQTVRKGDILLRVNEEPFQQLVAKAEIGVAIAETLVAQARQAVEAARLGLDAQRSAVDAARSKVLAAEAELRRAKALKEALRGNDEQIAAAQEGVNALKAGQAAEEARLRAMEAGVPDAKIDEALKNVELRRQDLRAAQLALANCRLEAKSDGTVLRLNVSVGSVLGPQTRQAPVWFVPAGPRFVRAEVEQEFAHRVHLGQEAVVQDVENAAASWAGKVKRVADAFLPRRSNGEGLTISNGPEARTLECLIELAPTPTPPRLGQRVRVSLGTRN
jgi:multidrug resistance efflux pump